MSKNKITIHSVKNNWNREEVVELLERVVYDTTGVELEDVKSEVKNWSTKNL